MGAEKKFLQIASEELHMTPEEVMKYAKMDHFEADRMLADAWYRANPQTEADVIGYYTAHPEFSLFHLRFICNMNESCRNEEFFNKMIRLMPDIKTYKILDYGCGSGQIGLTLINSGCNEVTMADVPLPLFKIIKRMLSPYIGEHRFMEITEKYPLKTNYDLIICVDVLEHVRDPDLVVKHLADHCKYLYLETFFGGAHAPYHLVENNRFIPIWKDILNSCTLIPVHMNDEGGTNGLYKHQND